MPEPGHLPLRLSIDETVLLAVGLKLLDAMVESIEIAGQAQDELVARLLGKLSHRLPENLLELAEQIVHDIVVATLDDEPDGDLAAMTADSSYALPMYAIDAVTPLIEEAIAASRSLDVTYYSMSREQFIERRIDPYGMKEIGGLCWLVAYCHLRDDRRVFRVDRIRAAKLSEASFTPPGNFQISEYFDE